MDKKKTSNKTRRASSKPHGPQEYVLRVFLCVGGGGNDDV